MLGLSLSKALPWASRCYHGSPRSLGSSLPWNSALDIDQQLFIDAGPDLLDFLLKHFPECHSVVKTSDQDFKIPGGTVHKKYCLLLRASRLGEADNVRVLLKRGISANAYEFWYEHSALMLAASYENPDTVKVLLEYAYFLQEGFWGRIQCSYQCQSPLAAGQAGQNPAKRRKKVRRKQNPAAARSPTSLIERVSGGIETDRYSVFWVLSFLFYSATSLIMM